MSLLGVARRIGGSTQVTVVAVGIVVLVPPEAVAQGGLMSREEALAQVFPGASLSAERVFLTPEQRAEAAALAEDEVENGLIARYVATQDGRVVGRAYIDTHIVRTKRESLLVSLEPNGRLRRIDVTAFLEPPDYLAPERWRGQYPGRSLDDDLALQRAIRPIAGATLTALAVNAAVRRVMAIDRVLEQDESLGGGDRTEAVEETR